MARGGKSFHRELGLAVWSSVLYLKRLGGDKKKMDSKRRKKIGIALAIAMVMSIFVAILGAPMILASDGETMSLPGFEAVFAIAGLMAIAYLVLRRRPELSTAILAVVMISIVLIPLSAAGSSVFASHSAIAGIIVTAIIGISVIIGVAMWIARSTKKSPTFPRNSFIYAIMIALVLRQTNHKTSRNIKTVRGVSSRLLSTKHGRCIIGLRL